nr:DUF4238 domain-containing protein [uncultured Albidiferax sp.]
MPEFYLRAWYEPGQNGFWLYYRNARGALSLSHRPAKSVAYVRDLYSLRPFGLPIGPISLADEIETGFFGPIDAAAAPVLLKAANSSIGELTSDERRIAAVFFNSLIERRPERIEELFRSVMTAGLIEQFERRFRSASGRQALKSLDLDSFARNEVLSALPRYIVDEQFVDYLAKMVWSTFEIPEGPDHFLTSDCPLIVNGGTMFQRPIYLLSIALSPKRLLIVHADNEEFDQEFLSKLVVIHSIQTTVQAEKFVISSRQVTDSASIKYSRIVNEKLRYAKN